MRRFPRLALLLTSALLVVLVLALVGCAVSASSRASTSQPASGTPNTATATTTPTPGDPIGPTWTLTGMLVDGGTWPSSAPGGHAITLQFRTDLGQLIGNAGCNGYGAPYTLTGDALHVHGVGQTLIACGTAVDAEETAYLDALQRVERFALSSDGSTLILSSDDGRVQLTYRRS
jgi:heat shock protein HslJ